MKLFIAEARVEDGMLQYVDDNDPVEVQWFLGAHDNLESAQAQCQRAVDDILNSENELRDENEEEGHLERRDLAWSDREEITPIGHETTTVRWKSDARRFENRDLSIGFEVREGVLNPED